MKQNKNIKFEQQDYFFSDWPMPQLSETVMSFVSGIIFVLVLWLVFKWLRSGRRKTRDGYIRKRAMWSEDDRLEHRIVAESILGRKLKRGEVVHHINGRRWDNRPENLCVMLDFEHERYHKWYDWVHQKYGKYPRRETQLRKLRQDFRGQLLAEYDPQRRTWMM